MSVAPLTLQKRILRALAIALGVSLVVGVVLHTVVVLTAIPYATIGEWAFKYFTPAGVLLAYGEKKFREWKKEATDARELREKSDADRALLLKQEQDNANMERRKLIRGVARMHKKLGRVGKQVDTLVADSQNNDGSTARDRSDQMFAELKALSGLIGSTTSVAALWAILDKNGTIIPLRASDAFVKMTGMSHEQTRNRGWLNFVAARDQVRVTEIADVSLKHGRPYVVDFWCSHITSDDPEFEVRMFVSPERNPVTNKIIGWTAELYRRSDPAVHMHRRATDFPNRVLE